MDIQIKHEFIYKKRETHAKNIRIPNNIKPLPKGNYLIKIFKIELECYNEN